LPWPTGENRNSDDKINEHVRAPDQGCQIFLGTRYQNGEKYTKWPQNIPNDLKIYQMTTKYTKWPQNIPDSHKIFPMGPYNTPNGHEICQNVSLQDPPNFPKLGFIGLKTNHLATLLPITMYLHRYMHRYMLDHTVHVYLPHWQQNPWCLRVIFYADKR
jgi:hypothetical protein